MDSAGLFVRYVEVAAISADGRQSRQGRRSGGLKRGKSFLVRLSPPRIAARDMRAEPVFVQIQAETRTLGNREHALAHNRFRALRHFFLVTSESAQSILHFEEVLRRSAQMHGGIESDQ